MDPITLIALLTLAAAGGMMSSDGKAKSNQNKEYKDQLQDTGIYKVDNTFFTPETSNSTIGSIFREYALSQGVDADFLNSYNDNELGALIRDNYADNNGWWGFGSSDIRFEDAIKDIVGLQNSGYSTQSSPNYAEILQNAENTINAENREIEAMYDNLLAQQTQNFQNQLSDSNKSYNDMARQILSNNYMQNTQLMSGLQSQMDRTSRNALEAGASAGLRLAGNINTLLSVQNQQASKSLETSNQLAQMLLNQRQAAAGIRGDYMNAQSQNMMNKANLRRNNAERIDNYANTQFNTQQRVYDQQQQAYNEAFDSKFSNNALTDAYKTYKKGQTYTNKYGY